MLVELRISNFAIIEKLELHFGPGLVIFTGETGAGKSILIDAVELLLGGRAEATFVRHDSEAALIEGIFKITPATRTQVHALLESEDLLDDPDFVTLGREIRLNGRNVARLNGRTVSVSLLREVGSFLVDVHGQSEHLSLLKVGQHLKLLDSYAGTDHELQAYQQLYSQLKSVRKELADLRRQEAEAARLIDTLNYQINEIETARLTSSDEADLTAERNRLANAENLAELTQSALVAIDEGAPETPAATDLLGQVVSDLEDLSRLDNSQSSLAERAHTIFDQLTDLAHELRLYAEEIEFNPRRLDQVEERLALIQNLKRKYGGSIQAILEFARKAKDRLELISHAEERMEVLAQQEKQLLPQLGTVGENLSHQRHMLAEALAQAIEIELSDLQMDRARFRVDFQQNPDPDGVPLSDGRRVAFDQNGLEQIEFVIAPNPGEGFKPLVKIASGGETSRLMLALKHVLARADQVPTLIFDEIDQGIGGRVGTIVGKKLRQLAGHHQVLCVTHLPQLAAFGERHFHVSKHVSTGRTTTTVDTLNAEARINELAQMLGEISPNTRRSAQDLLERVNHELLASTDKSRQAVSR